MKKISCLVSLLLGCLIGNAQEITRQSIIVRDSVGSIISINEKEYRNDSIVRNIHFVIDKDGRKIPSYKIDYSQLINKNHVDSVLTYYAYKGTDSIQDKIVTFSFDIKKKLLISQMTQYVNKVDVVYPSVQLKVYKYNRTGKVVKVKYSQKNGSKMSCEYIDKISYKNNNVTVKRFFFPSYNNKGKKVFIPRRECELYLLSTLDDDNRVICQKEKQLSENDIVAKVSRFEYDNYGNLAKTDFYSQTDIGELYLYSDFNEIKYESGKIISVIHYRETSPDIKVLLFSEEYLYK